MSPRLAIQLKRRAEATPSFGRLCPTMTEKYLSCPSGTERSSLAGLPFQIVDPIRRNLRLEPVEGSRRRGAVDEIFPLREPREYLPIDRRRMVDHVGIVVQIMGDFADAAKIVQANVGKGRKPPAEIGGEIVDAVQRPRRRRIAHRDPL